MFTFLSQGKAKPGQKLYWTLLLAQIDILLASFGNCLVRLLISTMCHHHILTFYMDLSFYLSSLPFQSVEVLLFSASDVQYN